MCSAMAARIASEVDTSSTLATASSSAACCVFLADGRGACGHGAFSLSGTLFALASISRCYSSQHDPGILDGWNVTIFLSCISFAQSRISCQSLNTGFSAIPKQVLYSRSRWRTKTSKICAQMSRSRTAGICTITQTCTSTVETPMMYRITKTHGVDRICLLRVDVAVLDLPGTVITDCNAASNYVRFSEPTTGLSRIDKDELFSTYWTHPDQAQEQRHKSRMCAEVLVPDRVEPSKIIGAYVGSDAAFASLAIAAPSLNVTVDTAKFFA